MKHLTLTYPVSSGRIFFYLSLLTALLAIPVLSFQSRSADVIPSGGKRVEALPGKLLTLSFKVTNTAAAKKRFESVVVAPPGWRRLAKDFPFELEAGASDIRLVSISIPAETPAGEFNLRYGIRDPANPSDVAEVAMTIVITAVKGQGLKLMESPRLVVAGDPYVSLFLINNKGNTVSTISLVARSSTRLPAELDSSVIHLKPGESRTIRVKVTTDASITTKVQDILELTAELDSATSVKANSYVDVVPRVTGVEERYVRFPVEVRARFAGEQTKRGAQIEVVGSGALSNSQDDRLDVLVRTPDIQQKSILGRRDEYQLSYTTKSYDAYLGDKNFSLSPLTEFNRYAFGASGGARFQNVEAGAFYNASRFFTPSQKEWAGYLTYKLSDRVRTSVNYLGKMEQNSSHVVSLRSLLQPYSNNEVDLEYGVSTALSQTDHAYAVRWTGQGDWIAYDARYVHAGSDYAGYYKNLDLKNLSVNLAPLKDLRIEGYYREEDRNLNRDTLLFAAPYDRYYQAGLGYANLLTLYYRVNDQDDKLPVPRYQRREETWQIRAGFNLPSLTMIANADLGSVYDKLAAVNNPFQRYTAYLTVLPFSGHTYGFSAEYTRERDPSTFENLERLAGNVTLGIFLTDATQITMALYGNRTWGALTQTYTLFDVGLDHKFPWGHEVMVRGRQSIFTPSFEGKELAYLVEYMIPIGVPIVRSTVSGQLNGRVVDLEKGEGIQNVLVYAGGATALTDRNGEYYFPALKPDKYFVQLDMASVGLNRVALQQLPLEITIVGGQEVSLEISVSRSVMVNGAVRMYGAKEQAANDTTAPQIVELGGHPNVVLELSTGDDINRRVTDNRGRFTFTGIRPGRWTLRIIDGNLPQGYYYDKESYEITVAPGQSAEQSFKALPRRRRIQMIQQGKTVETAPQKDKDVRPIPDARKPVEPPPSKPIIVAPPKDKLIEKAQPPEIKKPLTVRRWPSEKPMQVPWTVEFLPAKLVFGIHHSDWKHRATADSAVVVLAQLSGLSVFVDLEVSREGKPVYRVILGTFKSRRAADAAILRLLRPH